MTLLQKEDFYSICRKLTYDNREVIKDIATSLIQTQSLSSNPPLPPSMLVQIGSASLVTAEPH